MMENLGEVVSEKEVAEMLREADLDGDGRISLAEFVTMMGGGRQGQASEPAVVAAPKPEAAVPDPRAAAAQHAPPASSTNVSSTSVATTTRAASAVDAAPSVAIKAAQVR